MWAERKVRIVDIAEELGVSTATVSNVLHGKTKKISARTVKRVQEKLEERGYSPNMAATLLAQNDSRIIGIVIHDHEKYEGQLLMDPFVASSVNYLSDEIEKTGHFMMLKKAKNIMEVVKFASMWNMVGMDWQRYQGLCKGLGFRRDFLEISMQKKERDAFYQKNLALLRQYSAIFAVSDHYALELMAFLQNAGIRIPEKISVVGFDDCAICRQVFPSLTSVRQDGAFRARLALQLLNRMRQEPEFSGNFPVSVRLIPRDSTGRLCD